MYDFLLLCYRPVVVINSIVYEIYTTGIYISIRQKMSVHAINHHRFGY